MDQPRQAGGSDARPLVHSASAPQQPQRAASGQAGLQHACSAQGRLEGAPSATPSDGGSDKVRKPYTITKQRERWTDAEHALFLEALREHGRAWRRIEEHIGTKTAVQIRSHAQKFFAKLEREQASGNKSTELPADLTIPPPRPKRKPARPYPKKSEPEASDTGAGAAAAQTGNGSGSGGLQRQGPLHGSQLLAASVASPPARPSATPSPGTHSFGTQALLQVANSLPPMGSSYSQLAGAEWAHQGLQRASLDAGVAAVAAAASAAAAAAAAAVVATADEATQARLQANPPQGFPFFGMPPTALALFASQMQGSPQVAGLAAAQQQALLLQQHQQQAPEQHGNHGSVRRPHARSPHAVHSARAWAGPSPAPSGAMEWTATSEPSGQVPDPLQAPSHLGSENDGDSACSRETRSRETRSGPAGYGAGRLPGAFNLRTGSGTNLLAGSGAAAAAAAASASAADRTMQLARAATFCPGGLKPGMLSMAAGADARATSVPPQWANLPIAALLQAAAVSAGQPEPEPQQQLGMPPVAPMTHSHLFKPPFKPASPDVSIRRAERAGKLRARRGGSEAAGHGGSGTHGGTSGQASFDNFRMPARQQTSGSGSPGAQEAAPRKDSPLPAAICSGQPSDSPPAGDAGSDGSQDSLLAKNGFGDGDSDKAEGYGSNPTGNGSSDGLNASNGSGNGNGSSDGGADDARKPSPPAPSGDGTSKAPGKLMPGERAPDPEQCAGKAHAHAHAQAHPHARTSTAQLAALQGLTNAAGMMPPSSAAVAAASANLSGWNPGMQALAAQQGIANPYLLQAAAAGQALNPSGLNTSALAALANAGVGNSFWAAPAAQLQSPSAVLPVGLLVNSSRALQQQVLLDQVQAQRQASLQLDRLASQRQAAAQYENNHIDGPRPQPGQAQHSAFEPASQKTPPPSFREPGPAKQAMSGRSGGARGGSGSPRDTSASLREVSGSPGDRALLERMPSRPRANRPSPMDPPFKLAAAVDAAVKGSGAGEVPLGAQDRDVAASGGSGRSSNASATSGFQPYRSDSGVLKRSISGPRFDVPPRKRLHSCALDQVEAAN